MQYNREREKTTKWVFPHTSRLALGNRSKTNEATLTRFAVSNLLWGIFVFDAPIAKLWTETCQ